MSIWLRSVQMFSVRFTWKRKQEQPIWFSLKTYGKHLHTNVDLVKKCANVFLAFFLWNSYRNARERCENMKLIALRKYDIWSLTICDPFHSNLCDVGWLFAIVNHFRGLAWMCAPYLFVFVLGFQTWFVLLSSSMAPSSRPGRGSWKHGSSWQHPLRLRI